jgi:hypothetical protein
MSAIKRKWGVCRSHDRRCVAGTRRSRVRPPNSPPPSRKAHNPKGQRPLWRLALGIKRERRKKGITIMGLNMKKYAGETFLKVADVRGGPLLLQIAVVREGKFDKADLVFESGDILSLNATNTKVLMRAYGSDGDDWIGKEVELYQGEIEYNGAQHEAVLVRPVSPPVKPTDQKKPAAKSPVQSAAGDMDDEIPF